MQMFAFSWQRVSIKQERERGENLPVIILRHHKQKCALQDGHIIAAHEPEYSKGQLHFGQDSGLSRVDSVIVTMSASARAALELLLLASSASNTDLSATAFM